ncbi:MAG: hypothetical protein U1A24_18165 [Cypionkella sp.]|uniref:hypothetical protein n=1 Tax=Cypionkella sp. TaxID=2811411 RepID=UPI002ABB3A1F|nr:hypothetical protein [Cypionkella sp.]MDZ4312477.1 hypothetical protein [Cypionkella sp.]
MTMIELTLAIFVLLITPGPTNTLLFLGGAERGHRAALWLIPAELAGYLVVVVPLTLLGAALLHDAPRARAVVAIAAGLWVAWLALKLWLPQNLPKGASGVSAGLVFTTTMLNPKALIFGLVLLPSPDHLVANLGLFAALVVIVAAGWAGFGAWLGGMSGHQSGPMLWFRRGASVWLSVVSLTLLAKGLGA